MATTTHTPPSSTRLLPGGPRLLIVRRDWSFWLHLSCVILFGAVTIGVPLTILRVQWPYPDLNTITFIISLGTGLTLLIAWVLVGQTASLQLRPESFVVRKRWQRAAEQAYDTITGHNIRQAGDRYHTWTELTVYTADNWVAVRSIDVPGFDELIAYFSSISPAVPYRPVLSSSEQNLARWFLGAALLTGLGPVWFGFAAYEPVGRQPVPTMQVSARLDGVSVTRNKGRFTGVDFRLIEYPDFTFHARKGDFDVSLGTVPDELRNDRGRLVRLFIRQPDFLRKISRQQPLTFGDKYDDYSYITVVGISSIHGMQLRATPPIYGEAHTQPYVRLALYLFYGLIGWALWLLVSNRTI